LQEETIHVSLWNLCGLSNKLEKAKDILSTICAVFVTIGKGIAVLYEIIGELISAVATCAVVRAFVLGGLVLVVWLVKWAWEAAPR
jgi:hypothetical protein